LARQADPEWKAANVNDLVGGPLFFVAREDGTAEMAAYPAMPSIQTDSEQMQQILLNPIIDARQASGGQRSEAARASTAPTFQAKRGFAGGSFVEVSVADNGPGIPPEKRNEIFQPLYTAKNQGTGLGLQGGRRMAEAYGGAIHIVGQPGEGAAFLIWPPRERRVS
jgi:signal transduction histidine kinase